MRYKRGAAPLLATILLAASVVLVTAPPAHAATIEVTSLVDVVAGGGCPGPDCSLREAVLAAADGDVISLEANAIYELTDGELVIGAPGHIVIEGNGATIEQTSVNARVLHRTTGDLTVRDLSVTGGNITSVPPPAEPDGGGILIDGLGTLTVERSRIASNEAAGDGGGIHGFRVVLVGSKVNQNTAGGDGGGVALDSGMLVVTGTAISSNEASGVGGGAFIGTAVVPVAVTGSVFSGNEGGSVGGMAVSSGDAVIVNSSVLYNVAAGRSSVGGVVVDGALTVRYVTFAANEGEGGASLWALELTPFAVALSEPVGAPHCSDSPTTVTSQGHNAADDDSCGLDHATDQQSLASLMLDEMPMNPNLHRPPAEGSPLLDAVPLAACAGPDADLLDDQLLTARPQGTGCDIGAVEVVVAEPPPTTTTPSSSTTTTSANPSTPTNPSTHRPSAPPAVPVVADPTYAG